MLGRTRDWKIARAVLAAALVMAVAPPNSASAATPNAPTDPTVSGAPPAQVRPQAAVDMPNVANVAPYVLVLHSTDAVTLTLSRTVAVRLHAAPAAQARSATDSMSASASTTLVRRTWRGAHASLLFRSDSIDLLPSVIPLRTLVAIVSSPSTSSMSNPSTDRSRTVAIGLNAFPLYL